MEMSSSVGVHDDAARCHHSLLILVAFSPYLVNPRSSVLQVLIMKPINPSVESCRNLQKEMVFWPCEVGNSIFCVRRCLRPFVMGSCTNVSADRLLRVDLTRQLAIANQLASARIAGCVIHGASSQDRLRCWGSPKVGLATET